MLAGLAPAAQFVDRCVSKPVEVAALGVTLDLLIEARRIKLLEPGAKAREIVGGQLGDSPFNVFDGYAELYTIVSLKAEERSCPRPHIPAVC